VSQSFGIGQKLNNWGEKARQGLDGFVRRFLVIPYDYELAQVWAQVMEKSMKEGRRFEAGDCWIAATAVHRNVPLLSCDKDFVGRSIPNLKVVSFIEENK
jgi:predicted nucleic acid-binding protein